VREVCGFGENVQVSRRGRLYFSKLSLEIFHEDLLQASAELDGLFSNYFEALVQCFQISLCHECSRLEGFSHVRILGHLAYLAVQISASFSVVASVTKEHEEHFFGILSRHGFLRFCLVVQTSDGVQRTDSDCAVRHSAVDA
jgi:hypothetical protein